jgi:hypothetical protein
MTARRTLTPGANRESGSLPSDPAVERLQRRLSGATKEELLALVMRLANDSESTASRLDYLTDPSAAAKALQRRISAVRAGKRFIDYRGTGELAAELATIAADIRSDVLSRDPGKAAALAYKFVCIDQVIFDRADDSSGVIGDELRAGCVLWLDAAATVRATSPHSGEDWPATLHDFYQGNEYGVREPLLERANRLLHEDELRALAARFEADARRLLDAVSAGHAERFSAFGPSCAMGLVACALRDPGLYEQSILVHSPKPNALQANDIAAHYLAFEDGAGALRWLSGPGTENDRLERLDLLDRAYELVGDRNRQIEIRREVYRRAPGVHSYRALEELLPIDERSAFRLQACEAAKTSQDVASGAELLFALEEPGLADRVIIERCGELDGRDYGRLTALVKIAKANGCLLAATLIWRSLLDAILARGYAKAYGHAARYLLELRAVSGSIQDYRGHPSHETYEAAVRLAHGRKASFWARLSPTSARD